DREEHQADPHQRAYRSTQEERVPAGPAHRPRHRTTAYGRGCVGGCHHHWILRRRLTASWAAAMAKVITKITVAMAAAYPMSSFMNALRYSQVPSTWLL